MIASLDALESAIDDIANGDYASADHTHDEYALTTSLDALTAVVSGKADSSHTHDYAATNHTHSSYVSMSDFNALEAEVDGKANASHTHDYAASSHTHDNYAVVGHDHDDDYAAISHNHSEYATATALSEVSSAVSGKANASHTHDDRYYTESEVDSKLAAKSDTSHTHAGVYDVSGAAASALTSANAYTDAEIANLLNNSTTAVDSIMELAAAMEDNADAIDALEAIAATKASASDLTSHIGNTSNPHNVTLSQLGVTATASELNKMDGVTATTTEINYLDGVTSSIQTQLNAKAASGHTHSAATSSAAGLMSAADKSKLDGIATGANAYTLPAAGSSLGGVKSGGDVTISSGTITVNDDSHNHVISNVDGLQSALDGKAASSHTHNYAGSSSAGGAATSANKLETARTISLTGDVTGSTSFDGSGNVSITATVSDDSHNHTIANVDGLQSALDGKSATSHNHNSAYISKDLQFLGDNGGVMISYLKDDGKNILTEIASLPIGFYTVYSQSGTSGNPKTTEAWRFMVHKTGTNTGWVQGYGSVGSVYTNYLDGSSGWRGWRCLWDNDPNPLWSGQYYMSSPNSTPQTVTPSKKLSECRTGWLLLWSDYDPGTGSNDSDFVTTVIPKNNPSGGTWGGKSFLCDIPRYVGSNTDDVDTERRIIKPIYVHDDCIKGSYQNDKDERNDVVLRAVYEI